MSVDSDQLNKIELTKERRGMSGGLSKIEINVGSIVREVLEKTALESCLGYAEIKFRRRLEMMDTLRQDEIGRPATLMEAVSRGDLEAVRLLLVPSNKVDPNQQNNYGGELLMEAVRRGHTDILELLLKSGVGPDKQNDYVLEGGVVSDNYGGELLMEAARRKHIDIMALLLKNGIGVTDKQDKKNWKAWGDKITKSRINESSW